MYLGSVRFFKHLILTLLFLIFIVPTILAIIFGVKYSNLKSNTKSAVVNFPEESSQQEKVLSVDDISRLYKESADKITTDDVYNSLVKNGIFNVDELYKRYYADENKDYEYQDKYPELYATAPESFVYKDNVVYLTFDDGPSENTVQIINILEKYNIKATFFVSKISTDRQKQIAKMIIQKGHTIGIHSKSHNYSEIYRSVDTCISDLNDTYIDIYNATGVKPNIIRFAGGSINSYNQLIYKQIISEVCRRGFIYYDWNVSGEDASTSATWTSIYRNVLNGCNTNSRAIVLLHDGADKKKTVMVVEDLILALQKKGFEFDKLQNDVKPMRFGYID